MASSIYQAGQPKRKWTVPSNQHTGAKAGTSAPCPLSVLGGATGLVYATDYRDIVGIIIPATRRGYAWQGDYQDVSAPLLVAIDMGEITTR